MSIERIEWICPVCRRRYAIPATAPTPTRCPKCREAESEAESSPPSAKTVVRTSDVTVGASENPEIAALAAIQLEMDQPVSSRQPPLSAARDRHKILRTLSPVYAGLAVLAAVAALGGLLFSLRAAFVLPPTAARAASIIQGILVFAGSAIGALTFLAFRELIRVVLSIEEHTRPR